MPETPLTQQALEVAAHTPPATADDGLDREITVEADMESVTASVEVSTEHLSASAWARYYWDKTKAWAAGVQASLKW